MFDQRCQATVDLELGLRLADRVAQLGISLAHANAEALHGDAGLDDPEFRPAAYEPRRDRRKFHENVEAAARQIIECLLDLVISIDPCARRALLGD
jgi:hypothetical protein